MPVWILGVAAVGGYMAWSWFNDARRRLRDEIRKVPRVPLRYAPENQTVRLTGVLRHVDPDNALEAPISLRACAAWHVTASRQDDEDWTKVLDVCESQSFILEDGDDVAYVDATTLELLLLADADEKNGFMRAIAPHVAAFLRSHDVDINGILFQKPVRVQEGVLEEGERITVVGRGRWVTDPSRTRHGYREVGRRFELGPMADGRLLASDEVALTGD